MVDKFFVNLGIGLIVIPIMIFCITYLNIFISIPSVVLLSFFWFKLHKSFEYKKYSITLKNILKIIPLFILILLWVKYSGIGGFSYQNGDFWARNSVFSDLVNYKWPIIFENGNAFCYYFAYWIPAAFVGKIFGMGIANIFLYFFTIIYVTTIVYLLQRITKKNVYLVFSVLVLFSGLDIVGTIIHEQSFVLGDHIEWWAKYFQYSSMTSCLYWVFNQILPIWLIVCLLLNTKSKKMNLALCSLLFAYSPWATIGIVPIAIIDVLKLKKVKILENIKQNIISNCDIVNILVVLWMLIIYGSFYLSCDTSSSGGSFIWEVYGWQNGDLVKTYLLFVIIEFGIYVRLTFSKYCKNKMYLTSIILLLLIPMYHISDANDFCMRASLPALFILMIFVIQGISFDKKINSILIIIVLLIGSVTPVSEIYRSVVRTHTWEHYLMDGYTTVSYNEDEYMNQLMQKQFHVKNYKNKTFFKYFTRK